MFTYLNETVPTNYVCSKCSKKDCKLWRQYQTVADCIELLCGDCSLKDQKEAGPIDGEGRRETKYGPTDQIGWLVPAIPTVELDTYWGYTSVPQPGVLWWRALPTRCL